MEVESWFLIPRIWWFLRQNARILRRKPWRNENPKTEAVNFLPWKLGSWWNSKETKYGILTDGYMWKFFFLDDELSLYYTTFYVQNSTDSLHILSNPLFLTISEMYRTSSVIVNWHSTIHWLSARFRLPNLGRRFSASTSIAIVECVRSFDVTRLCVVWLDRCIVTGKGIFQFLTWLWYFANWGVIESQIPAPISVNCMQYN